MEETNYSDPYKELHQYEGDRPSQSQHIETIAQPHLKADHSVDITQLIGIAETGIVGVLLLFLVVRVITPLVLDHNKKIVESVDKLCSSIERLSDKFEQMEERLSRLEDKVDKIL